MRSRLKSHLTESATTVFHSGLGRVDPVSVRIELTRDFDESASYEDRIALLAALLHERHHWLQHVGTSTGLFGTLLLELQNAMIEHGVPLEELRTEDLPLLRQEHRFADALGKWERLEATRRLYFGCRRGDLDALMRDGRAPLWGELAPLVSGTMGKLLADSPYIDRYQAFFADRGGHLPVDKTFVTESGWSVGARHLMEGAARQSEVFRLLQGALDGHCHSGAPAEAFRFNLSEHYTGVYGVARKLFDSVVGARTVAADIGFAFACDMGLNALAPPLYPLVPVNPGTYFAHVVHKLADFRFDRCLHIVDPPHVRALIAELTEHVGVVGGASRRMTDLDLRLPQRFKREMVDGVLGHLRPDEVAGQLFTLPHADAVPVPSGPSCRLRYLLALTAEAERIRARSPEIFVFPAASYLDDRTAFRALFERIQPPLLSYGSQQFRGTRPIAGWPDFFVATGIHYEVMRGLVMHDARTLGISLAPFARLAPGLLRIVLRGALHGAPVADVIHGHAEAAAEQR
ncbi:hypothetical protein [Streptomyces olindensis]|uniref:hypothetical protein n=1 Tax=Streptomyces olindensis TaxID=358823 RepID=UPI0036645856